MNEMLNHIFDEESIEAIKNANTISPSPETIQARQEVVYKETTEVAVEEVPIKTDNNTKGNDTMQSTEEMSQLKKENNDFKLKLEAQKDLIQKIVKNQNEMVNEVNQMQDYMRKFNDKLNQLESNQNNNSTSTACASNNSSQPTPTQSKAPAQQTGAGEGLDPNDYSVESIFDFSNKK